MHLKINTRLCGTLAIVVLASACAEPVAGRIASPEFTTVAGKKAFAADSERSEVFPTSMTNPCNGEEVVGTARYHVVNFINDTPNGLMYRLTVRINYDGVGSFGNKYNGQWALSDAGKFDYTGGMAFGTGVDMRVISQGKSPNFTTRFDYKIRIDDEGHVAQESNKISESCN